MKKIFIVCCVVLAIVLVGCKSQASAIPPTTTDTNNEFSQKTILHDTFVKIEKDSSFYRAYLECVNGKVVMRPPSQIPPGAKLPTSQKGKHINAPNVNLKDNVLEVDCKVEAQKLFYQWKEQWTREHKTTTIKIPYEVKLPLTWWETTQIWLGRLLLLILFIIGLGFVLRLKKII